MKPVTLQMNIAEKALVAVCGFVWRCLLVLDPQRVQRYFAAKVNVSGEAINLLHRVSDDDSREHVCRINNNRMKEGSGFLAKRGELLKIYNPANGKFVFRYVHGSGELRIRYNEMGLDYDAQVELGVLKSDAVDLQVMKANPADREFYLMYQDRSVSSRQSRALGWYLLLGSLLIGSATSAIGWIGFVISLII